MGVFYKPQPADAANVKEDPAWWRLVAAAVLLGLLFWGALETSERPEYAEASETLLRAFEIVLAGFLALLGIETVKN